MYKSSVILNVYFLANGSRDCFKVGVKGALRIYPVLEPGFEYDDSTFDSGENYLDYWK